MLRIDVRLVVSWHGVARLPVDGGTVLRSRRMHVAMRRTRVVGIPGVVALALLDELVFLIANGSAGDRAHGASDEATCGFVVSFVTDRDTKSRSGETAENDASPPITAILRTRFETNKRDKENREDDSLVHGIGWGG